MRRIAAHRIFPSDNHSLQGVHYLEVDEQNMLGGIYRLESESEAISFFNGTLFLTDASLSLSPLQLLEKFQQLQKEKPSLSAYQIMEVSGLVVNNPLQFAKPVDVFILDRVNLPSSKFRADNGSGYGHIQRL